MKNFGRLKGYGKASYNKVREYGSPGCYKCQNTDASQASPVTMAAYGVSYFSLVIASANFREF